MKMQRQTLKLHMKLLGLMLIAFLTVSATSASAANLSYGYTGKGKTTCGGLVNGKLQKSCGSTKAVFEADAVGECPTGTFFDVGKWSCWSCPTGYVRAGSTKSTTGLEAIKAGVRALVPVDAPRACEKKNAAVTAKLKKATYQGKVCPQGTVFDPTRDGECWSCPRGYERSLAPVEWADACVKSAKTTFTRTSRNSRATGIAGTDCPKGQVWDITDGYCYSCPSGYNRNANAVKGSKACDKVTKAKQSRATLKGKAVCKVGEILDIRNHGECWTCPTNYDRTTYPINESKACEIGGGFDFSQATETSALTCNAGQIFDFVNAKHPKVKALYTQQFNKSPPTTLGKKGGGTCWSCPAGYRRTILAVWDKAACESNGINWKPPEYTQPGLFGLDGAAAVARQEVASRILIEEISDGLAAKLKKDVTTMRREVWAEIATKPDNSAVLKLAVLARLQAAAATSGMGTVADRKLLRSFETSVVHYKTFLAQQSLDAYRAWDAADRKKSELFSAVVVAGVVVGAVTTGGAASALYGMGAESLKNELWPLPDFTDITLRSVIEDEIQGNAIELIYTKALLSKTVLRQIFPKDAAIKVAKKTLLEGTEAFEKKLGKFVMQKISKKIANKAMAKGAGVTAKMVAKAFASAGPQIVAEVAIDTVVAYIEMQIERANAEPRLKANVAEAKRPFQVGRLLATVEGSNEVSAQWAAVIGGKVQPKARDGNEISKIAKANFDRLTPQAQTVAAPTSKQEWIKVPGKVINDIAITADGTTYAASVRNKLYHYDTMRKNWAWVQGVTPVRIAAATTNLWGIGVNGKVFVYNGKAIKFVTGPKALDIGASGKHVWIVAADGKIYQRNKGQWKQVSGTAQRIAIDVNGRPWVVNKQGNVYMHTNAKQWQKYNVTATDVAIDAAGSAVITGTNGRIYAYDASVQKWINIAYAGGFQNIAIGGGKIWAITKANEVFRMK